MELEENTAPVAFGELKSAASQGSGDGSEAVCFDAAVRSAWFFFVFHCACSLKDAIGKRAEGSAMYFLATFVHLKCTKCVDCIPATFM